MEPLRHFSSSEWQDPLTESESCNGGFIHQVSGHAPAELLYRVNEDTLEIRETRFLSKVFNLHSFEENQKEEYMMHNLPVSSAEVGIPFRNGRPADIVSSISLTAYMDLEVRKRFGRNCRAQIVSDILLVF